MAQMINKFNLPDHYNSRRFYFSSFYIYNQELFEHPIHKYQQLKHQQRRKVSVELDNNPDDENDIDNDTLDSMSVRSVAFTGSQDDNASQVDEISEIWEISSVGTEQVNYISQSYLHKQFNPEKRIIKYLHIQPLEEESKEVTNVESCITFFSQILNATLSASKGNQIFPSGYCFDCGLSHSSRASCCWQIQSCEFKSLQRDFNTNIGERKVMLRKSVKKGVQEPQGEYRRIEEEKACKEDSKVNQSQMINFAFMMLQHKIQISAEQRAKGYFQKMQPLPHVPLPDSIVSMVQETYRILLLPEEPLRLYLQTISAAKKLQEFNNSMKKLNLKQNKHPYAKKAALKLKNAYEY